MHEDRDEATENVRGAVVVAPPPTGPVASAVRPPLWLAGVDEDEDEVTIVRGID